MSELSDIKKIAKKVREYCEDLYDWKDDKRCFVNTCHILSRELEKKLKENDIYCYKVNGLYSGASDDFIPDMYDWNQDDIDNYNINSDGYEFNHWWVVVENKYIVDLTADQFHPGEEDNYRIIITDFNDIHYKS